jgi:hypothetical protein
LSTDVWQREEEEHETKVEAAAEAAEDHAVESEFHANGRRYTSAI